MAAGGITVVNCCDIGFTLYSLLIGRLATMCIRIFLLIIILSCMAFCNFFACFPHTASRSPFRDSGKYVHVEKFLENTPC